MAQKSDFSKINKIYLDETSGGYLASKTRLISIVGVKHPEIPKTSVVEYLRKSHVYSRTKKSIRKPEYRKNVSTAKDQVRKD
jgi:hypothetical protein